MIVDAKTMMLYLGVSIRKEDIGMSKKKVETIKVKSSTYELFLRIKSLGLTEDEKKELAEYVEGVVNEKG